MSFIDNKIKIFFSFTDYFINNKKSINDIVKFSISDEQIDYGLSNESIKNMRFGADSSYGNSTIYYDNTTLESIAYSISTDGEYNLDDKTLFIDGGKYIDIIFDNSDGFFVEFLNKDSIKKIIADGINETILEKSYIYIKKSVRIYFSDVIMNNKIWFFSEKRNMQDYLNIQTRR